MKREAGGRMAAPSELQTPLIRNFIAEGDGVSHGGALGKESGSGEDECSATVFGTTVNLCNTIIGAGLLTLPFAIYVSGGLLNALALFVLVAVGSACGFLFLCECCEMTGKFTYKELGESAIGTGWPVELHDFEDVRADVLLERRARVGPQRGLRERRCGDEQLPSRTAAIRCCCRRRRRR